MEKDVQDMIDFLFNPLKWDKESYCFNREEKDMHPYSIVNTEKELLIIHNILGNDKKDLKINVKEDANGQVFLNIKGDSIDEYTKKKYSINSKFQVDPTQLDLDQIHSVAKNGLLYIFIPWKKEKTKTFSKSVSID